MGNTIKPLTDPLPKKLYALAKKNNIDKPNCNIDVLKLTLDLYGFIITQYEPILQATYKNYTFTFVVINSIIECRFYDKMDNNNIIKWYNNDTISIFINTIRKWA